MNWKNNGVAWFGYHVDSSENIGNDFFEISVIIGSKAKYDFNAKNAPNVDLNSTLFSLSHVVKQGTLSISVDQKRLTVRGLAGCENLSCNSTYLEVTAPPRSSKIDSTLLTIILVFLRH